VTYFIDANIPMYAAGKPSAYKAACVRVLAQVAEGALDAVTDTEVLQELAYRYVAIGRLADGLTLMSRCAVIIPRVLPVELADVLRMAETLAAVASLSPRDAIHYAVMQRHGISAIITADRHFASLPSIVQVDPRELCTEPG
jgi:uncharacterized protein